MAVFWKPGIYYGHAVKKKGRKRRKKSKTYLLLFSFFSFVKAFNMLYFFFISWTIIRIVILALTYRCCPSQPHIILILPILSTPLLLSFLHKTNILIFHLYFISNSSPSFPDLFFSLFCPLYLDKSSTTAVFLLPLLIACQPISYFSC